MCHREQWSSNSSISSFIQESEDEEIQSEKLVQPLFTEEEENKLPVFKHEEGPPESEDSEEEEDNFINDEEDPVNDDSRSEVSEDSGEKSDDSESYVNPYMERNDEMERQNIFQILSKSTEKDKTNKRRYGNRFLLLACKSALSIINNRQKQDI